MKRYYNDTIKSFMFINSMATILSYEKPTIINNQFFEFFSLHNAKVAIMLLIYKF